MSAGDGGRDVGGSSTVVALPTFGAEFRASFREANVDLPWVSCPSRFIKVERWYARIGPLEVGNIRALLVTTRDGKSTESSLDASNASATTAIVAAPRSLLQNLLWSP